MQTTAIIHFFDHRFDPLTELAGVPLVHRAMLTGQRAGIYRFYLLGEMQPSAEESLRQDHRIKSRWTWLTDFTELTHVHGPLFVYGTSVLMHAKALQKCLENTQENCALYSKGQFLGLILTKFDNVPFSKILSNLQELESYATTLPNKELEGFGCILAKTIPKAEKILLHSYASSLDGIVDVWFNRPVGRLITLPLIRAKVNPNTVTIVSGIIGLIAAGFFLSQGYWLTILAALLLQFSAVVDCMDGDIARLQFRESQLGRWLDIAGDNVVHVFLFSALMWREYCRAANNIPLILGGLLVIGTIIAFALVIYSQTKLLKYAQQGQVSTALAKLHDWIDRMTSRDFTVLLILGAVWGDLLWFLWLAAIGTQVFWISLCFYILMIFRKVKI